MITSLAVQSHYHVEFYSPWSADKSYDVQIVGMVNTTTIAELDSSYDLKKEYFTAYNLGVATFLRYINASTRIYVVRPIKSYDPTEVDDETSYFIPESLVDFTKSYQYLEAKRYTFTVETGIKKFSDVIVEDEFYTEARTKISKAVGALGLFIADKVSTDVGYTDVLTTQTVLDTLDTTRENLISLQTAATKQEKDNTEQLERNLYIQINKAQESKNAYDSAEATLHSQLNTVKAQEIENNNLNIHLTAIKTEMVEIISQIRSGVYAPENFPTFDELWDKVSK